MKILVLDVETAPILANVWRLFDENVGLNQIKQDWHLLSYAAKWLDEPAAKVMYSDQRNETDISNDRPLLKKLWKLLDQADVVIAHNGNSFDVKKINARFILQGFKPPSSYRVIDTLQIAKRKFGFTSNKLEYLTGKLCVKYKKYPHKKYPGFDLWAACLAGTPDAWEYLRRYNIYDILSLEELYHKLQPWYSNVNFQAYPGNAGKCNCGSTHMVKNGHNYTNLGKYARYKCADCGAEFKSRVNLYSAKEKKRIKARLC